MDELDLGATLRALRRQADISQRELAGRAGLPESTVARIEAGVVANPKFRTIERIVRASGAALSVLHAFGADSADLPTGADLTSGADAAEPPSGADASEQPSGAEPAELSSGAAPVPSVPHEDLRDAAGRHYAAHLDVRETFPIFGRNWEILPAGTCVYRFEVDREHRDRIRDHDAPAADVRIERDATQPDGSWMWIAITPAGSLVGRIIAQRWPRQVQTWAQRPESVLCSLTVDPDWRDMGLEQQLVGQLKAELASAGVVEVVTLAYRGPDGGYLKRVGFAQQFGTISMLTMRLSPR